VKDKVVESKKKHLLLPRDLNQQVKPGDFCRVGITHRRFWSDWYGVKYLRIVSET